jgi:hypothetical protein
MNIGTQHMKKVTNRICPICEWTNAEILHTQKFILSEGHPFTEGYYLDNVKFQRSPRFYLGF